MSKHEKPIVIFGTDAVGEKIWRELVHRDEACVAAFSVDRDHMKSNRFNELPVIAYDDLHAMYPPDEYRLIIGVGYSDRGTLRVRRFEEARHLGYEFARCVSCWAVTWESVNLGEGSSICAGSILDPTSIVGDNVFIGDGCVIPHHAQIDDHVFMASGVTMSGRITVETGAFIGTGAVIRNGVTIGRDSIVGAGAVILEDTEPNRVYIASQAEMLPVPRHSVDMD